MPLPTVSRQVSELEAYRGARLLFGAAASVLFGRLHIPPVVTDFLAAYPEINIRLLLTDRNLHVIDDHVDMAIRIGTLPDSSMVATRIGSMRTVVRVYLLRTPQGFAALPPSSAAAQASRIVLRAEGIRRH